MGFLSGLGRMFQGGPKMPRQPQQPRIMDYGRPRGGMGISPVGDQPYLQGPTSLGQESPLGPGQNPMEQLFGGSPSPDWSQAPGMGKPGGGFGMGQVGQAAQGIQQMMGQQEQQFQPYQPSWFGQFQRFGGF